MGTLKGRSEIRIDAMQRRCPQCYSSSPQTIVSIDARTVVSGNKTYRRDSLTILGVSPDAQYALGSCSHCGFVYALESLDDKFLQRLYELVIDPESAKEVACSSSWVAHQLELAAALLQRVDGRDVVRFLDYGCGEGTVVHAIRGPKVQATGFDPYAAALNANRSFDEVRKASPFDAVLLSDVLEHVNEPRSVLARCRELLAERGWLAVNVPDFSPLRLKAILDDLRSGRKVTPELNPWEHLNYFSPRTLVRMVEGEGFEVDAVPAKNFGFRNRARGIHRAGNVVRSAARLIRFAVSPSQGSTTLFAQRRA
jgi:2-polyprenyl-3-methyl-5-hydroxy-6-metoxy-1,4-benzoquinol methylase